MNQESPTVREARNLFNSDMNCAQSVLATFAPRLGINREQALRIASAFGAGMARTKETCGAVTGGLMVIGLRYGFTKANETQQKEATYNKALGFMCEFARHNGSLRCSELLSRASLIDPKRPEHEFCADCVADAVNILEAMTGI